MLRTSTSSSPPRKGKVKPKETVDQFALFENLLRFNVFVFTLLKIGFASLLYEKERILLQEYYAEDSSASPASGWDRNRRLKEIKETGVRALAKFQSACW